MSSGNGGKPSAAAKDSVSEAALDARLKELEAKEKAIAEKEAELNAKEAAMSDGKGRRFNPKAQALRGPVPYKFKVGPVNPKYHDKLPIKEIEAVDESEAKRWYAESHEDPDRGGQAVDTVRIELMVKCVDSRRAQAQQLALRLANIRSKRDSGVALSEQEEEMLLSAEEAALLRRAG